jgi:hypothetical protein
MDLEKEIFKGKTLSDLFGEIYENSTRTRGQVAALIADLKPLIESTGDATLVVPLIKEYMDIGVKNDDHLIKLATVIQRLETSTIKASGTGGAFEDLESILNDIQEEDSKFKGFGKIEDKDQDKK